MSEQEAELVRLRAEVAKLRTLEGAQQAVADAMRDAARES